MENKFVVLIIEDEDAISNFISVKLEVEGYRTIQAQTAQQGIAMASSYCPDLILLDLGLPDMDGSNVIAQIRSWSLIPIIIISARHDERDIVTALEMGADDYLTKPFNNAILLARIKSQLRKGHIAKIRSHDIQNIFRLGELTIEYDKRIVRRNDQVIHLTPIEYRILVLLSLNAGSVLTHEFLCNELWGPHTTKNKALRVNVANLRRKIEQDTANPRYILTEPGVGYRMLEE